MLRARALGIRLLRPTIDCYHFDGMPEAIVRLLQDNHFAQELDKSAKEVYDNSSGWFPDYFGEVKG